MYKINNKLIYTNTELIKMFQPHTSFTRTPYTHNMANNQMATRCAIYTFAFRMILKEKKA